MPERPPTGESRKIFAEAVHSKRDVTDAYLTNEGGIVLDALATLKAIRPQIDVARQYIETHVPHYTVGDRSENQTGAALLIDMASVSEVVPVDRHALFAIDGTPATPLLRYTTAQMFAGAVMGISYEHLERPETQLATTAPTLIEDMTQLATFEELLAWADEHDLAGTNQSWPTTFLEYIEREYAIQKGKPFTLIDGPLCTQNLLTQEEGRKLLLRFFSELPLACGVIKSIKSSTNLHRILAKALHPGEALLIEPSKQLIERRTERMHVHWLERFFADLEEQGVQLWRGVYRAETRAFGFECDRRHLDDVIAMLWSERDAHHIGHEIPFLLNQVDAHLRKFYSASSYRGHLTYVLGLNIGDDELFDEIDERELR